MRPLIIVLYASLLYGQPPNRGYQQIWDEINSKEAVEKIQNEAAKQRAIALWNHFAISVSACLNAAIKGINDTKSCREANKAWSNLTHSEFWPQTTKEHPTNASNRRKER